MEDEWNTFVKTKLKGTPYIVKEIDSETEHKEIADINRLYNVKLERRKYPTIFSINNGVLEYYNGERTVAGFSSMIRTNHKGGSRYRRRNQGRTRTRRRIRKTRRKKN